MASEEAELSSWDEAEASLIPAGAIDEPTDDEEWIREGGGLLQAFIEQEPDAMHVVTRIVGEHVRGEVDTETGDVLYDSLVIYLGEGPSSFLLTLLTQGVDDPQLIAQAEPYLGSETVTSVRKLLALYGHAIREAYALKGENPKGWRSVSRQVYYDLLSSQWRIRFEVIKYSGEKTLYEESPTTLMILAEAILDTLSQIPVEVAPEVFDEDRLELFTGTCANFFNLVAPDIFEQEEGEDVAENIEGATG